MEISIIPIGISIWKSNFNLPNNKIFNKDIAEQPYIIYANLIKSNIC